jgi:hypothetical protein
MPCCCMVALWSPILGVQEAWKPGDRVNKGWTMNDCLDSGIGTRPGVMAMQRPVRSTIAPICAQLAWPLGPL